jgi:hypothetical protein
MNTPPPGTFCMHRQFEWTMAVALTSIGAHLIFSPESGEITAFRYGLEGIGLHTAAAVYFILGIVRMAALVANGRVPIYGEMGRAACSVLSSVVWAEMAFVLYHVPALGAPSPYIWIYVVLTASESYSTFRAVSDGLR